MKNNKRVLITGGCGFVGSNVANFIYGNTDWDIVIIDRLNYAGSLDNLRKFDLYGKDRVTVLTADFTKPIEENLAKEIGDVNYILHIGAESHVDNSILDPRKFVYSNVVGTLEVLEFARTVKSLEKFIYFSTDEVFGAAKDGEIFKENDRYNSGNPYSATKAGGEELAVAFFNTYKLPVIVTHTMNIFGPRQNKEKFIPMVINSVINGDTVTIHTDAEGNSGSRFYIHAREVAKALVFLLDKGVIGEKYNIVGEEEMSNMQMAEFIAETLDKPLNYVKVDFKSLRPGYDFRYSIDGSKLKELGWKQTLPFREALHATILFIAYDLENKKV